MNSELNSRIASYRGAEHREDEHIYYEASMTGQNCKKSTTTLLCCLLDINVYKTDNIISAALTLTSFYYNFNVRFHSCFILPK